MRRIWFTAVVVAVVMLSLIAVQAIVAQTPCPADKGCAQLSLNPGSAVGDFYLGDQLLVAGQNSPLLQLPPDQALQIVVRNVQNPSDPNFNNLYVYQEATVKVNVPAGKVKPFKVTLKKKFIRGTLSFTCDPRNVIAGDDVRCQLLIDGGDRGAYAPGQTAPFVLDVGAHAVAVQLVGGSVGLWEPTRLDKTINIGGGKTAKLKASFDKRAHLTVVLSEAGVVGDILINDKPIGTQVHQVDLYVPAKQTQNIVVRNINPPPGGYRWSPVSTSVKLPASSNKTVTIKLKKESLVSGEQLAALNSMQSALDLGRLHWLFMAELIWTPLSNGEFVTCGFTPENAPLPRVSQSVLNKYPAYKDAFDTLSNAINSTNAAISTYYQACGAGKEYMDDNFFYVGVTAKNNAENFFNQAQDKINALRNNPQ